MGEFLMLLGVGCWIYVVIEEMRGWLKEKRVPIYTILFIVILIWGDRIMNFIGKEIHRMRQTAKIFYLFYPSSNILEYIDGCDKAIEVIRIKKIQDIIQKKKREKENVYFFNRTLGFKKDIRNSEKFKKGCIYTFLGRENKSCNIKLYRDVCLPKVFGKQYACYKNG